jgi:hypothetical protein
VALLKGTLSKQSFAMILGCLKRGQKKANWLRRHFYETFVSMGGIKEAARMKGIPR